MSLFKCVSIQIFLFPNMSLYKYRAISWRHHFQRCYLCCASMPLFKCVSFQMCLCSHIEPYRGNTISDVAVSAVRAYLFSRIQPRANMLFISKILATTTLLPLLCRYDPFHIWSQGHICLWCRIYSNVDVAASAVRVCFFCSAVCRRLDMIHINAWESRWPQHTATHCNTLQHTATHCNTLQHTATHCNILQLTATRCNTLQHTMMSNYH